VLGRVRLAVPNFRDQRALIAGEAVCAPTLSGGAEDIGAGVCKLGLVWTEEAGVCAGAGLGDNVDVCLENTVCRLPLREKGGRRNQI
jgi:hypothetical protein